MKSGLYSFFRFILSVVLMSALIAGAGGTVSFVLTAYAAEDAPEESIAEDAMLAGMQYNLTVYDSSGARYEQLIRGSGVSYPEKAVTVIFAKTGCDKCEKTLEKAVRVKRAGGSVKILYVMFLQDSNSAAEIARKKALYPEVEFVDFNENNKQTCWDFVLKEGLDDGCGNVYTPVTVIIPNDDDRYPAYAYAGNDADYEPRLLQASGLGTYVKTTSIQLNKRSANIAVGGTLQLSAAVSPANATYRNVRWKSDDETIATIDANGLVTGKKDGSTWIYAYALDMSVDNYVYDYCRVTVENRSVSWSSWQRGEKGWRYILADGSAATSKWISDGGNWYYFGKDSYMVSGWQKLNNKKYYFGGANDGRMKTGWQKIGDGWYHFGGIASGVMKTGWQQINNRWYHFGGADDGRMRTGWQNLGGKWYFFGRADDGAMKTGWIQSGGKWYYMGEDGAMLAGTSVTWKGKVYRFDRDGVCTNP